MVFLLTKWLVETLEIRFVRTFSVKFNDFVSSSNLCEKLLDLLAVSTVCFTVSQKLIIKDAKQSAETDQIEKKK